MPRYADAAALGPLRVLLSRDLFKTSAGPLYPENAKQLCFAQGSRPPGAPPRPLPSPAAPGYWRGTDRSLTVAVEELEPVVNPVIGLFAVGFLGCSRTQRYKKCRRGRRELVDRLRGIFSQAGTPAGEPDRPGSSRNCGQL